MALSLAVSILKDPVLAEDVLQEAFIKVFRKIGGFQGNSSFKTWLYRIVVNTSYNALKKQDQQSRLEANAAAQMDLSVAAPQPVQRAERKQYILAVLNSLKPDEALTLRLFYLGELSIVEIRQITGFSKGKIKTNLHRGRKNFEEGLRKLLGAEIHELL